MNLQHNLFELEQRILAVCDRAGRKRDKITLIAVSKTQSVEIILQAYDLGIRDFGENRVQELLRKKDLLPQDIRWHLIGHLQSNKAKYIAGFIHYVHSIDSLETAKELSKRAMQHSRKINILLEVNVAAEESKEGIASSEISELSSLIFAEAASLNINGLMTVAPYEEHVEQVRPYFKELHKLCGEFGWQELSMGMSNDFEVAIEEGATMIRIGSLLFGERTKNF